MQTLFAHADLFAQQQRAGPAQQAGAFAGVWMILCVYGVIIAVAILIQIMFLLSLSRCFKEISKRNRRMEPGQVWLCLIPIFGFVWLIILILRLSESLEAEYEDRGLRGDGDFGKTTGLVYVIGSLVCGPLGLIFWIMYWVKVAGYTRTLRESGSGGGDYDYDDEDDRPRRKKSRHRDEEDDDEDEDRDDGRRRRRDF